MLGDKPGIHMAGKGLGEHWARLCSCLAGTSGAPENGYSDKTGCPSWSMNRWRNSPK